MMQLCGTMRLFKMTSALCATLVVVSLASLALAAPLDVKVKAKGTEEVLMYGNHQNAPRVKKSDLAPAAAAAAAGEDAVEETAEVKDNDLSARAPAVAGQGQGGEAESTNAVSSAAVETDSSSSASVEQQQQEQSNDEDATESTQQAEAEEAYDPDAYFPYFSPYRRKRASAKALTAEDMTLTSSADDVRREKRSAVGHGHSQPALTAEDMTLTSSSGSRARRDAPLALTAEDMTSSLTSAKRLQRFKRNIYDGYVDEDEDDEGDDEEEEKVIGGYKPRDLDIDDLSEEEQALLLRYIESNPDLLDALSQYGADERQRAEQWERARQAEAEEEDIREALQYLDQLEDGQVAAQSDSDDDDPEIEYEPIVYHGEPGIFIPVPAEVVGEVEKRSRWQEVAEEEAEREQYEEAYARLLDLARALRRHDYEQQQQEEEEEEKK